MRARGISVEGTTDQGELPGRLVARPTFDIDDDLTGRTGLAISAGAGLVGAAILLATCWRPPAES